MKIYTRTGDNGTTGLFGGPRVSKDDVRIEAYGTVDELNASLGIARASGLGEQIDAQLEVIQHELFAMGAELSAPDPVAKGLRWLGPTQTGRLERWIDEHEDSLPKLTNFILPSGTSGACFLHLARGVCRRAERRLVTLSHQVPGAVSDDLIVYLNRLSDLLFVLSRVVNQTSGVGDVMWVGLARAGASREKQADP
jgi:cob(I)alamin adenosyltransferase